MEFSIQNWILRQQPSANRHWISVINCELSECRLGKIPMLFAPFNMKNKSFDVTGADASVRALFLFMFFCHPFVSIQTNAYLCIFSTCCHRLWLCVCIGTRVGFDTTKKKTVTISVHVHVHSLSVNIVSNTVAKAAGSTFSGNYKISTWKNDQRSIIHLLG